MVQFAENIDVFEGLFGAILERAVRDYEEILLGSPESTYRNISELENFFLSDWFYQISGVEDGQWIINEIRRKVKNAKRKSL